MHVCNAEVYAALKQVADMKVCVYVWVCVCSYICMHVCNAEVYAALKQVADMKVYVYVWVCVCRFICMHVCNAEVYAALKEVGMYECKGGQVYTCIREVLTCIHI
jgi:hypothetical protein